MLIEEIPGSIPLMQNTDGLEMMIPEEYKEKYLQICKQWEDITQLILEHDTYQKIILADVNNYIGINDFKEVNEEKFNELKTEYPNGLFKKEDNKFYYAPIKCKGRFEFENLALHKNKSALIIPKALYNFFIFNTPPEVTIEENKNIFDFCIGKKIKGDWTFKERNIKNGYFKEQELQHTLRYYISKQGSKIYKCNNSDSREIQLESGKTLITIFNNYQEKPFSEYNIDTSYYLQAIYKELDNILGKRIKQLTLF